MNLGIDLGSTYTILSTYRTDHEKLEALEADSSNNVNIPSVISMTSRGKIGYGSFAKGKTGQQNFRTFKAFKMLLMESDDELIKERNYDDTYSPEWALTVFMGRIIGKAQASNQSLGKSYVDNLVVGAPNIWFHRFDTLGGRAVLKDICTGIKGVGDVTIVSEPVLASAYFAYNYQKRCRKPFKGCILIVDYGGGTLDLSLTQVNEGKDRSMEIKMLAFNGAGENTDHDIGNAGIVYHESLMEHIIKKKDPAGADDFKRTEEFYAAVNRLEEIMLQQDVNDFIEESFSLIGTNNREELEEEVLDYTVAYDGEEYEITCADLLKVYNDKIHDTFEEQMDEMIHSAEGIEDTHLDVMHAFGDDFRIALVGGFGNYYLVRNQMREKFNFSSHDRREKDIIETAADRERAISYGAALIASGVVGICSTAPYSIGIKSNHGGHESIDYLVEYKDEIDIDQSYYSDKLLALTKDYIDDFVIESNNEPIIITLKDAFKDKLTKAFESETDELKTFRLGVSFDNSDLMTLHIKRYNYLEQEYYDKEITIELGELYDAFEEKKEV